MNKRARRVLLLLLFLLTAGFGPALPAADGFRLELSTPDGPVTISIKTRIDGATSADSHHKAWRAYIAELMRRFDADRDGVIDSEEAPQLPRAVAVDIGSSLGAGYVAYNFGVLDADGNGKITNAELGSYYREFSSGPFVSSQAVPRANTPDLSDRLFAFLDKNGDHRLSKKELGVTRADFDKADQDANEILTIAELPVRQTGAFVINVAQPWNPNHRITQGLRVLTDTRSPVDLEVVIRFGKLAKGKRLISFSRKSERKLKSVRVEIVNEVLLIHAGKMRVEVSINPAEPRLRSNDAALIRDRIRSLDRDQDGKLTQREASSLGGLFGFLDANGNNIADKAEVDSYLARIRPAQAKLLSTRVAMQRLPRATSLMGLLDRNRDGRISPFEWKLISPSWLAWDTDGDGRLSLDDFPEVHQLHIARGEARTNWSSARDAIWSPTGYPALELELLPANLKWFFATDRNADGVITRREFLGPVEIFNKLDRDKDGMINIEEAGRGL